MSSLTILALLEHAAQTHPDKGLVFVQQRTETKTTYSQLWQAARVSRLHCIILDLSAI